MVLVGVAGILGVFGILLGVFDIILGILGIVIGIFMMVLVIVLTPLLLPFHFLLRALGRRGFIIINEGEFYFEISSETFRKK